ncbi:hypothetical protein G4B88_022120 [Cannabis sativa]|uniref:RNase H type-1 domain-containing protein n=1 Tax=Cannabis sativa TaxID=3483 RepID=A0A7J6FG93_CANSA|nr:hypothetical protein G4B88_022120 [Cannabis sativa]
MVGEDEDSMVCLNEAQLEDSFVAVKCGKVYSVLEVDLQGILLALQMARDLGFRKVTIETNSKTVVPGWCNSS